MLIALDPRFYRGPVGTVHYLMNRPAGPRSSFQRLVKAGMLAWTVEWLLANDPKWHPLFTKWPWLITQAEARVRAAQESN